MNENTDTWKIIHIADKPSIPPNQQPTVDVFASVIEPKHANTIIRLLNQILPLENLRHVKRVKKCLVGGQLSVILCLACEKDNQLDGMAHGLQELINSYQLNPFITKVCKYAPSSKEEWEEQCKLWPTSYHPPTYNINGITGFDEKDSQSIFSFMKFAVRLAKSCDGRFVNAAVIVDPSVKKVIASACDEICSWFTPEDKPDVATSCFNQLEAFSSCSHSNGVASHETLLSTNEPTELYTGVSCLYPRRWAEQLHTKSSYWHPLRHAAMVAIETAAARDRNLFPSLEHSGNMHSSSAGCPTKRQKTCLTNVDNDEKLDNHTEDSNSVSARPYLCTGYDIYVVWEPCAMCAMALVHQRVRRIFYAFPNPNAGALGSVHRLQGEKSLNHHYAVFQVLLPDKVLHDRSETCEARTSENAQRHD